MSSADDAAQNPDDLLGKRDTEVLIGDYVGQFGAMKRENGRWEARWSVWRQGARNLAEPPRTSTELFDSEATALEAANRGMREDVEALKRARRTASP